MEKQQNLELSRRLDFAAGVITAIAARLGQRDYEGKVLSETERETYEKALRLVASQMSQG